MKKQNAKQRLQNKSHLLHKPSTDAAGLPTDFFFLQLNAQACALINRNLKLVIMSQ